MVKIGLAVFLAAPRPFAVHRPQAQPSPAGEEAPAPRELQPPLMPVSAPLDVAAWPQPLPPPEAGDPRHAVGPRSGQEAPGSLPRPPRGGGWVKTASSLLLFDGRGSVAHELGLGESETEAPGGVRERRTMSGGVSPDGKHAWHWQRVERSGGPSGGHAAAPRALAWLDERGSILWLSERAEAPPGLEPLFQSRDGRVLLLLERFPEDWRLSALTPAGDVLLELSGVARIDALSLDDDGRAARLTYGETGRPVAQAVLDLERGALDAERDPPGTPQ